MELSALQDRLWCLANFQALSDDPVFTAYLSLLDALTQGQAHRPVSARYARLYYLLRSRGYAGLGGFLWDWLRFTDTPYARTVERGGGDAGLAAAAAEDLAALRAAASFDLTPLLPPELPRPQLEWTAEWDFDLLTEFYRQNGCGLFARYRAFRWSRGELIGVARPDSPQPWELWGYAAQRQQVYDNVRAFLDGRPVNHVLLYGDSGTGKSATVKSLLSQPGFEALRIVELDRNRLGDIPALVSLLEHRAQKFLLFLDDLTFEADDSAYSQLKTILEGSLERRRDNVVVYATSNRRNLVRQTFSERAGDEVDLSETIAEQTSLVDRFGVRILFPALSPGEFLSMVSDLADLWGLSLPPGELEARARQWELRHPGRTPRAARQFLSHELDVQAREREL